MRVLLVDLARGYGGVETRVASLARALQRRVERCAVAVVPDSPLHRLLATEGVPCEVIRASRADPRLLIELTRVIRRGRYRVVDAHNIQSIFWGHLAALAGGGAGRVTTLHSDLGREYRGIRGVLYPAVLALMRPVTREFVHVTELLQAGAVERGDGARSTLIHNTVPVPPMPLLGRDPEPLAEWGLSSDDFVVAVVGRLFPVKGHAHLIRALDELRSLPRVRLLIVGDGPLRTELEALTASLGLEDRVRFVGFRGDVPRVLRAVDCLCLPSLWEALPYVVLEAAAWARPIVATAVGGIPSLLRDRETALLVPGGDPAALAAAIRRLVEHPDEARRLGRAAHGMVRHSFSEDRMVRLTLGVYDRAAA